jgi:NAD(P)-dependent dehydrogenase (short-subunit alcohol dehydrogenase family)
METQRKVAVITGGTAGVGRATVREFARRGYSVAILARGAAGLKGAAEDVQEAGARALPLAVDVADADAVHQAAATVESELGEISVWVNVAFAGALTYAWDTSLDEFRRMTEVTYYGQVYGTLTALEHMRPRNRGVIINVGSALAYRGIPLQSAYCGAKHAVVGFSESIRCELAHEKSEVHVCMVQLPAINTPQFNWNLSRVWQHPMPVPPIFQPEIAARGIAFLAEHPRRNMWIGLTTAYTILAERVAPLLLDRYLGRTGISSQQTGRSAPRLGDNLWQPRDDKADQGARGAFTDQSHSRDPQLWLSKHRRGILLGTAATAIAGLAGMTFRAR